MKKDMFATCVGFSKASSIIDTGKEITKKTFLKHCNINPNTKKLMKQYPNDYRFYKASGKHKGIFYFEHSRIEHFFR